MKIAFIGTHGVGKTTLCYETAVRIKRSDRAVEMVSEVARCCPLPINESTTPAAQAWILHTQIAREIEACDRAGDSGVVICDRSVLDNYAYWARSLNLRQDFEWDQSAEYALMRAWMRTYDVVAYVPLRSTELPAFDGVRSTDPEFQAVIDVQVSTLVDMVGLKLPEFLCLGLTESDRVGTVLERVMALVS